MSAIEQTLQPYLLGDSLWFTSLFVSFALISLASVAISYDESAETRGLLEYWERSIKDFFRRLFN